MAHNLDVLKNFMDTQLEKFGFPGIDCIIYQDHEEVFRYAAGYADMDTKQPPAPDALYHAYSGTKMITCTAAMQLVEQGKMLLLDPVSKYLPEYGNLMVKYGTFTVLPAQKKMRILDLFNMTAGISYEVDTPVMRAFAEETKGDFNTREFVAALAKDPLKFEPGDGWCYGFCHDVLGAIIEVISGKSLGEYLKENIFEPLGMKDTFFRIPEEKQPRLAPHYGYDFLTMTASKIPNKNYGHAGLRQESGGAGLITSVNDYILFADAMACIGVGKTGNRIISERSIKLMSTNRLSGKFLEDFKQIGSAVGSAIGVGYGLGVGVVHDSVGACTLVPNGTFYWGGYGGFQNHIDTENKLSFFVAMHNLRHPQHLLRPYMLNILYSNDWSK